MPSKIEYRGDFYRIDRQELIKSIRIVYEEEENPELEEARKLIRETQRIFFLGFGYAKENLKLLKIPEILNPKQKICGTALGLTSKEFRDIQNIFPFPTQIGHEDWDCLMLLRQCW